MNESPVQQNCFYVYIFGVCVCVCGGGGWGVGGSDVPRITAQAHVIRLFNIFKCGDPSH